MYERFSLWVANGFKVWVIIVGHKFYKVYIHKDVGNNQLSQIEIPRVTKWFKSTSLKIMKHEKFVSPNGDPHIAYMFAFIL